MLKRTLKSNNVTISAKLVKQLEEEVKTRKNSFILNENNLAKFKIVN